MGSSFSLDDLKGWVEDEYGPVGITDVPGGGVIKLLPFLRLPRDRRDALSAAINDASAREEQKRKDLETLGKDPDSSGLDLNASVDEVTALLRLVAEKPADIDRLVKAFRDDGQMLVMVWEKYQKDTRLGDPEPSESSSTSTGQPSPGTSPAPGSTSGS